MKSQTEPYRNFEVVPASSIPFLLAAAPELCERVGTDLYRVPRWAWRLNGYVRMNVFTTRAATMALCRLCEDGGCVGDAFEIQVDLADEGSNKSTGQWMGMIKELRHEDGRPVFSKASGYLFNAASDEE